LLYKKDKLNLEFCIYTRTTVERSQLRFGLCVPYYNALHKIHLGCYGFYKSVGFLYKCTQDQVLSMRQEVFFLEY
jgi:hypothetical protein